MTVEELIEELKRHNPKDRVKVVRTVQTAAGTDEDEYAIDQVSRDNGSRFPVVININAE